MGKADVLPRKLYKYRHVDEKTKAVVTEQKIWAPSPSSINDPFDCRIQINAKCSPDDFEKAIKQNHVGLKTCLNESRKLNPRWEDRQHIDSMFSRRDDPLMLEKAYQLIKKHADSTGILSLSATRDEILMWSHYANDHKGVCLEFDTTVGHALFCNARRVRYKHRLPAFPLFELDLTEIVRRSVLRKAKNWKYEKEWRVLIKKANYCTSLPNNCLTGIILGVNISDKDKQAVFEWCHTLDIPPRVYQAEVSNERFALEIDEIELPPERTLEPQPRPEPGPGQ